MARPTKPRAAVARTTVRTAQSRRTTATVVDEGEVVEESGLTLTDALVIVTTLFLLLGLGTIDYFMGGRYDQGFLF